MDIKHTPGPWMKIRGVNKRDAFVICPAPRATGGSVLSGAILLVPRPHHPIADEETAANALVCKIAPEMRAALRAIEERVNKGPSFRMGQDIQEIINGVWARAEGG